MKGFIIGSSSSGQGKTSLTLSILAWLKKNNIKSRPFKIGPDYIDIQFHEKVSETPSVNLDNFLMSSEEIIETFNCYSNAYEYSIIEGVMGYYDGLDYNTSTYDISKILDMAVILIIPAQGTYNTIVPIIKGLIDYRKNSNIKGVILNRVSSESHYNRLQSCIKEEIPNINVLGWIKKDLNSLQSRHLGLDLRNLSTTNLNKVSTEILENIDVLGILKIANSNKTIYRGSNEFDFSKQAYKNSDSLNQSLKTKKITIVNDNAFSFIYTQNKDFFKQMYKEVKYISSLDDESIPEDTDTLYIPGGYIETADVYSQLANCNNFKNSLINFSNNPEKKVFAECAGLMYLGRSTTTSDGIKIDGANILPLDFTMSNKRNRLGYYRTIDFKNLKMYKGHCFHYSIPHSYEEDSTKWGIFKEKNDIIDIGAWSNPANNVLGTYLHSFFFNQPDLIYNYFN